MMNPMIPDCRSSENEEKIYPGDFVQVIDNRTQNVIIQGQIRDEKPMPPGNLHNKTLKFSDEEILYTVDDKYFFKLDDDKYTVKKFPKTFVDSEFLRQNYAFLSWVRYSPDTRKDFNLFVEHGMDELDKEVVRIVRVLNRFSMEMKTVGSCCGHGKSVSWITLQFNSSRALEDFLNIFQPFNKKMSLTTDKRTVSSGELFLGNPYFPYCMVLELRTNEIGDEAYKVLNEFADYIEKIIDVRNKAFKQLDEIIEQEEARILQE